ncbi:putative membrane protein [Erysiphe neolycopersici]|uniref:Glycerophosphocholine acyltransferase 1 n=1 Tax=Erysiphe neolycopersici TaxID=212602 RepID=A0A420HSQ8_9PEZI|nr:putative membrane protein [Erysiphe neolycopersici]
MTEPLSKEDPEIVSNLVQDTHLSRVTQKMECSSTSCSSSSNGIKTPNLSSPESDTSKPSRNASFSEGDSEDWEAFFKMDRLTVFDLLDNFAFTEHLEKFQKNLSLQTEKVRRQKDALKSTGSIAKEFVVEEWRKRVPSADEQLERYLKLMRENVDKLGRHWNDTKAITFREKISFICGVLNVLISGYLIGASPQVFHIWYTLQLFYFMPIRYYTYQKRGYHYFLADLCYFVNVMCMMAIWVFPNSKRLFISSYCLAFGNNAIAIAMWRNSLVFHSFDKVTSLFIHIMPCVSLHCLVHLIPDDLQQRRFNAAWTIKNSAPGSPEHYSLLDMALWSTVPYAVWQLTYHFLITVRRREKIAAGRPTSFTWLRKSYSNVWIGKIVLSLPECLHEPTFMGIQYIYALLTMLPCPLWFWYRSASTVFLMAVFCWSVYNGATYYIDVFGKRFQSELEAMKLEVQKWQNSPQTNTAMGSKSSIKQLSGENIKDNNHQILDKIPLLSGGNTTGRTEIASGSSMRERKAVN